MRKPRGRNLFTKTNVRRAIDIAREAGLDRVEVETAAGRYVFPVNRKGDATRQDEPQQNEWDQAYGTGKTEVR
jgi:hypothetical protein